MSGDPPCRTVPCPQVQPVPDAISVIIPNLDSPLVDRTVDAVFAQHGASASEVLVVGRDGPGRLRGDRRVRVIPTDGPKLPGAARNVGVAAASGRLLVFVDADCVPEPDWLRAHQARHRAGETLVGGAVLWDARPYWTLVDNLSMFHECDPTTPAGRRRYLPTLNLSVSRAAFEAAGPMDPGLPRGEDLDWTIRAAAAGHAPYFEPAARVWHRPPRATARAAWRHWRESGRWMVTVRRRHPRVFHAPPWAYHRALVLVLAPLLAAAATARVFGPGRPGTRYRRALPGVYVTKLAWCAGAAFPALAPEAVPAPRAP